MRTILLGLSIFVFLFSCSDATPSKARKETVTDKLIASHGQTEKLKDTALVSQFNLVDVQALNKDIFVELKYATADNFMGVILYERLKKAYLQKDVAERLSKVQDYLSQIKPGFHLVIYDALRPVSVQQKMWDALDSLPPVERGKFVSNPKNRSLHNMGAAVDLSILDQNGLPLDMGAGYDDIRQIAYPSMEKQFVADGQLTAVHMENRDLLRKVMKSQGFRQLQTEWWHFNACSRSEGLLKYKVLFEEP
jgi:D-alanyl-D-alanine dipeptidase